MEKKMSEERIIDVKFYACEGPDLNISRMTPFLITLNGNPIGQGIVNFAWERVERIEIDEDLRGMGYGREAMAVLCGDRDYIEIIASDINPLATPAGFVEALGGEHTATPYVWRVPREGIIGASAEC